MKPNAITARVSDIASLAQRYRIRELALFGSALREELPSGSDIDLLVVFEEDAHISLFDLVDLQSELERLFGRPVDLVEKAALRNPFRRAEILRTARTIYAA